VVLHWYETGRHISKEQMKDLYRQAFLVGNSVAKNLVSKLPRRKPRVKKERHKRGALPTPKATQTCPTCGRESAVDATFCQYCGSLLQPVPALQAESGTAGKSTQEQAKNPPGSG